MCLVSFPNSIKMKDPIYFVLALFLLIISCKDSNSENKTNNSETEPKATVDQIKTEDQQSNRKQETLNDKVADILKTTSFFEDLKDASSTTENGVKVMVSSSYEYVEKDAKKVLDGQACVDMIAMGYGSKSCANFKNGVLDGIAYEAVSTPSTTMLKLVYKDGELQKASIFSMEMESCKSIELSPEKTLKELKAELENLLQAKSTLVLKASDCPKEMNELFN
jgi:hypothetical protein